MNHIRLSRNRFFTRVLIIAVLFIVLGNQNKTAVSDGTKIMRFLRFFQEVKISKLRNQSSRFPSPVKISSYIKDNFIGRFKFHPNITILSPQQGKMTLGQKLEVVADQQDGKSLAKWAFFAQCNRISHYECIGLKTVARTCIDQAYKARTSLIMLNPWILA